jgi:hypothetical protein
MPRWIGAFMAALACLALSACLLAPGKFTSELDLRKNGSFTFSYTGEIHMLALSKLAGMDAQKPFAANPCYGEDEAQGQGEQRDCTAKELADQKAAWEEDRKSSAERRTRDADSMKAIFGGIDLSSPRAAGEIAQRLRRQAGWKRVDYKGDGLYDVDFSIAGKLDHDFTFPTIERFPMSNAFVQIALRGDGTARIDAPGFAPGSNGEPLRGMAMGLGGSGDKSAPAGFPQADGTFVIRTDGAILANNTDEGPKSDPAAPGGHPNGQRLDWVVNVRTPAAPMALVRLER